MSSISIKWQAANSASARYLSHRLDISSAVATLRSVKSYRCMNGRNFTSIYRALDREISRLEDEKRDLNNLENGLKDILGEYKKCENDISSNMDNPFEWTDQNTWDIISNLGIIGSIVSAIGRPLTGSGDWKAMIKSGKDLLSFIGNVSNVAAGNADVIWKELFGFKDALKDLDTSSVGSTFTSSFKKQFVDDLFPDSGANWGTKTKAVTKWAGHFLTFATNAIENYQEFEGTGNVEQAVSETVIETAVDIGVGALATAGVSCAASWAAAGVAAGTIFAPVLGSAVVIGAGAALVTWAANGICKWVTGGDDLGEVVADFFCEDLPDIARNAADAVGKAVGSAAKAVEEGWNAFTKWGAKCLGFA